MIPAILDQQYAQHEPDMCWPPTGPHIREAQYYGPYMTQKPRVPLRRDIPWQMNTPPRPHA